MTGGSAAPQGARVQDATVQDAMVQNAMVQDAVVQDHVRSEQVRTLYRQTTPILIANACSSLIVAAAFWGSASRPLLLGWVSLMAVALAGRWLLGMRYEQAAVLPHDAQRWGARFAVGSAATGVLWGAAAALLFPGASTLCQLIVSFTVGGMCAAAAGTLASHFPAFIGFVAPALGALFFSTALGEPRYPALVGLIAVYAVALSYIARNNHRAVTTAFVLRFENAGLIATLSRTQASLEESNRTLEQRVAERTQALEKQAEALRDAQRMEAVGRLAGGVAHDFNNLLTVMLANLSDLCTARELDTDARVAIQEANEAAEKGAALVRQLLTFSRRQQTAPEIFDLNATVGTMERLLGRLLGERLTLDVALHGQALLVHLDPTHLEQVIMNLATNARDAMPSGGTIRIETSLEERSHGSEPGSQPYAVLSVRDTGVGMDRETRQRIFEPFFTTKDVGKGTGLGLATVYGAVEQSGGRIEVSSEPGQGSCFRVFLPLAQARGSAGVEGGSPSRRPSGLRGVVRPRAPANILLVEDEPGVRTITQRMLVASGYRVLAAANATEASALFEGSFSPIDLLVTDVVMPGLDGPALAARLRAAQPQLPVLFISGYRHEHVIPSDPAGTSAFLAKPFARDVFLVKVIELLERARKAEAHPALRA